MPESRVPFSARNRGQHRQVENDFPIEARVGLLHLLYDLVERDYVEDWASIAKEVQRIARLSPVNYNSSSHNRSARADAESALAALAWAKVFDFCERLHSHLAKEDAYWNDNEWVVRKSRDQVQEYIAEELLTCRDSSDQSLLKNGPGGVS